jgi:hypothetical protein
MIEDVSQVMTKHITNILTGVIGEYTIYKETHDTIMGLPCVRKLQERIMELEQNLGGDAAESSSSSGTSAATALATAQNSREDEIAQLQTAIIDLNRYINALESKVENNTRGSAAAPTTENVEVAVNGADDEESVKLKIQENDSEIDGDDGSDDGSDSSEDNAIGASIHKNVIITADAIAEVYTEVDDEEAEEEVEDTEAEAEVEDTEAEAEVEKAEAEKAEEDAEVEKEETEEAEEDAEVEKEEAETEEEEAEETEADAEEAEEAEEVEEAEETKADAEEAEEAEEADDAEIEVSEVKIKGKTYFTTDSQNGIIYACVDDDVGDEVGVFKNGIAVFNKTKK